VSDLTGLNSLLGSLTRSTDDAIAAGTAYLQSQQRPDGLWADFVLAPGESDEWVTGYVGSRLAAVEGTEQCRSLGWNALVQRSSERAWAGWGFSRAVPTDADSTAWALRLAAAVDESNSAAATQGLDVLQGFRDSAGAFSTYVDAGPISDFIEAVAGQSLDGWLMPHACVTAAACAVTGDFHALEAMQQPDGRWTSYWWSSDSFATALACEVVDSALKARGAQWACTQLVDALEPFERANLVAAAVLGGRADDERVRAACRMLAIAMRPDGSWKPSAQLRVPDPGEQHPETSGDWVVGGRVEGALVVDHRALFTTATVVHALALFQAQQTSA